MIVKTKNFSPQMLDRFLHLQRLSFSIIENLAASLTEGMTEREVGHELVKRYRAAGFTSFFHLPVVLYRERTALPGEWGIGNFYPKSRPLEKGDSVIMDASPLMRGYLVDTSYSFCFGTNEKHREMMLNLSGFRDQVLEAVNQGESFRKIAEDISGAITGMGYHPVHEKHPGEVLGHRAAKFMDLPFSWRVKGFDAMVLGWFNAKSQFARMGVSQHDPLWNQRQTSEHAPHDGLWLVEPHAGCGDVGAKWEEILVIENGKARWLDDHPPHVRQWQQIRDNQSYQPVPQETPVASAA